MAANNVERVEVRKRVGLVKFTGLNGEDLILYSPLSRINLGFVVKIISEAPLNVAKKYRAINRLNLNLLNPDQNSRTK